MPSSIHSRSQQLPLLAATLLLTALLLPWSALAQSTYEADATAIVPTAGFDAQNDTGSGVGSGSAAVAGAGAGGPGGSASATAQAGFQSVGVFAGASGTGSSGSANANGVSRSEFSIVPADPALWGTTGELLIALNVNGSTGVGFGPSGGGTAFVAWEAFINGSSIAAGAEQRTNDEVTGDLQLGPNPVLISLLLGPQFVNTFQLGAGVAVSAGTPATAVAAFNETFSWGGILELRDAEGDPITDFTAPGGDPGTDWRAAWTPIPEPSTAILVMTGLSILSARSRARAQSA